MPPELFLFGLEVCDKALSPSCIARETVLTLESLCGVSNIYSEDLKSEVALFGFTHEVGLRRATPYSAVVDDCWQDEKGRYEFCLRYFREDSPENRYISGQISSCKIQVYDLDWDIPKLNNLTEEVRLSSLNEYLFKGVKQGTNSFSAIGVRKRPPYSKWIGGGISMSADLDGQGKVSDFVTITYVPPRRAEN